MPLFQTGLRQTPAFDTAGKITEKWLRWLQLIPDYSDAETVAGSNFNWSIGTAPSPPTSLLLFARVGGFGSVLLLAGTDYTLIGNQITTGIAYGAGTLTAWYRK